MTTISRPRYVQIPGMLEILAGRYAEQQFAPHFHDTYTFGIIISGACHFARSGTPYVARAGDLFVIHPYELHTGGTNRQGLEYRAVYIAPDWLRQLLPSDEGADLPYFPSAVYSHPLGPALRNAIDRFEPGPIETLLVEITKTCAHGFRRFVDPRASGSRIGLACRLLSERWADEISTAGIAAQVGLSRYHFIRQFHRAVGLTPGAYVRHVRLMQAKRLIIGGMPPARAAIETRFADQSHLTRELKRVYGVTPGGLCNARA